MKKRYKIGIGKFGFVINENNLKKPQGGMIEIVNLYNILSKQHDVYIISALDKNSSFKRWTDEKLDFAFVFNGVMTSWNNVNPEGKDSLMMFKGYTWPTIKWLNEHPEVPWIHLLDDVRYDINIPKDLTHYPYKVISGYDDPKYTWANNTKKGIEYGHFDKIFPYGRDRSNFGHEKTIQFGSMINDTSPKRTKKLMEFLTFLDKQKWNIEVKGKFKTEPKNWTGILEEGNTFDWLKKVKYTLNINVDPRAFSRKFWEFALNDVIVFLHDYDNNCNQIPKDSYLRVGTCFDLNRKMKELEEDPRKYKAALAYQHSLIKDSYLDGSFILDYFTKMIEEKLNEQ